MELNDISLNGFCVVVMVACATIAIRLVRHVALNRRKPVRSLQQLKP